MEELIQEYKQGRQILRELVKMYNSKIQAAEELEINTDFLIRELSLINGMIRDMTEAISLMRSSTYQIRGQVIHNKIVYMDPIKLATLQVAAAQTDEDLDPDESEKTFKSMILEQLGQALQDRMHLLTKKQRRTLEWWANGLSISEIAKIDLVSRQAVWIRLFGDNYRPGAIQKLRDGE